MRDRPRSARILSQVIRKHRPELCNFLAELVHFKVPGQIQLWSESGKFF